MESRNEGSINRRWQQQNTSMIVGAYSKPKEKWGDFHMPLHYPKYTRTDYESMPEWQLDCLLLEYGLPLIPGNNVDQKRKFAIGAFLWSDH